MFVIVVCLCLICVIFGIMEPLFEMFVIWDFLMSEIQVRNFVILERIVVIVGRIL